MEERRKAIKHVWFDVNGTLCLYTPEYNHAHDTLRYETYAEVTGKELNENLRGEYEKLYDEQGSNSMAFRSLGKPADFWMKRFNALEESFIYAPVAEIHQTLRKLKDIVPLSIFTNNTMAGTLKILREIHVEQTWFKHIVTGEEVPERKPSLHGYKLVVEKSGLPANQILYVGDRVKADVEPAHAMGLQACLVYSQSDLADYCFESFDELISLFTL